MHFTEDKPAGNYIINEYSKNSVTINQHCYRSSLYLSANSLIDDIDFVASSQLTQNAVEFIIQLAPEIVILGTGEVLEFPDASVIAYFAQHKIGFETMDHAAACRTYSVLSAEQRNVGTLLLLNNPDR